MMGLITEKRQSGPDRTVAEKQAIRCALEEWNDLVDKHAAKLGGDRARGAIAANRERPDLRVKVDALANT